MANNTNIEHLFNHNYLVMAVKVPFARLQAMQPAIANSPRPSGKGELLIPALPDDGSLNPRVIRRVPPSS